MALVDEVPEIVGRPESARRREEPDDLVAPRAREGVLHHRHELDVREAQVAHVRNEIARQLPVRQVAVALLGHASPRTEVHLVDRHRPVMPAAERRPIVHPVVVAPLVLARRAR